MKTKVYWLVAFVMVAQLFALAVAPAAAGGDAPAGAYSADSVTLDSETMHEIAILGEQMQGYLTLEKDGTLSLGAVDTAALDVSDAYLEDYKEALGYINAAVEQGLFTVDADFQVLWPEGSAQAASNAMPADVNPDWGYHPIDSGLYIYFGYSDVHHYLPTYGLTTAASLGSYLGRPWITVPYTYHFTYYPIYGYYHHYAYPCCGVWSYVPWSYLDYYTGYYYPTYQYIYFWYPYGEYWYYYWCYW